MWQKKIIFISIILSFFGCKTQEQIAREKMVDGLSVQMVQNQRTNADTMERIQDLEEKLLLIGGKLEESTHSQGQTFQRENQSLRERLEVMEEKLSQQTGELASIKIQLKEQKAFLEKVLKNIQSISKKPKKKSKKKAKKLSPYDQAISDYRRGRYKKAKSQFLNLLDNKKIKGNKRARIIHNLGMISYMDKRDQDAIVYFSRLFTEYPKAPYLPNGLLFLAKTFKRGKKTDQAKQTLNELVKKYPKARQIKEAKKLLKKL